MMFQASQSRELRFSYWATWTDVVVVLHRVKTRTFGFFYLVVGYFVDAAIYPLVVFPLDLTCPRSTQALLWRLGACFLADHLVLVV
jgi:hypothetical protein